jgi:hypothetical protein
LKRLVIGIAAPPHHILPGHPKLTVTWKCQFIAPVVLGLPDFGVVPFQRTLRIWNTHHSVQSVGNRTIPMDVGKGMGALKKGFDCGIFVFFCTPYNHWQEQYQY